LITVVEGWRALGQPEATGGAASAGPGTTILITTGENRRLLGLAVDEVVDLMTVAAGALEPREALAGVDPILVRAVGRRDGQAFVVLDTDALLAPVLTS
jgi:chemotaxis signal transduction protein